MASILKPMDLPESVPCATKGGRHVTTFPPAPRPARVQSYGSMSPSACMRGRPSGADCRRSGPSSLQHHLAKAIDTACLRPAHVARCRPRLASRLCACCILAVVLVPRVSCPRGISSGVASPVRYGDASPSSRRCAGHPPRARPRSDFHHRTGMPRRGDSQSHPHRRRHVRPHRPHGAVHRQPHAAPSPLCRPPGRAAPAAPQA
jgi:hypothetical protein